MCQYCQQCVFPFNWSDDDDFIDAIRNNSSEYLELFENIVDVLQIIECDEANTRLPIDDLDPDQNLCNDYIPDKNYNCKYFNEDSFDTNFTEMNTKNIENPVSFCHINIRSAPNNLSKTLIDNIFTNNIDELKDSMQGLFLTDISDHFPVFTILWRRCVKKVNKSFIYRCLSRRNYEHFKSLISEYDWRRLYTIVDTDEAFSYFHEILSLAYNQAFPKKTLNKIYNTKKPWLTDCLKMTIKKKNKLYVISKKHPTSRNEQVYKTYRNRLNKIIKAAEKEYFSKQLEQNKSNMRRTWDIVKHVINKNKRKYAQEKFKLSNGEITCDKYVVCNKFNNFFVNIGPQLAAIIENQNKITESYLQNRQLNPIV